jgi:hypothetical protein
MGSKNLNRQFIYNNATLEVFTSTVIELEKKE